MKSVPLAAHHNYSFFIFRYSLKKYGQISLTVLFYSILELAAALAQGHHSTHASGRQHQDAEHQAQLGVVTSLRHVALRLLGGLGLVGALRLDRKSVV